MNEKYDIIREELKSVERESGVTILYACESGSRAWGFESADSDYDVRFIYCHPEDWYLSVNERRDVIEKPIDDELDVSGWDLRKALQLLRKSNPPLMEWLQSPTVYWENKTATARLRGLLRAYHSPSNCHHHYLHMAQGNFREYLRGDSVRVKKYFYVLRPLLACRWIERFAEPVPMEFQKLVEATLEDETLIKEIANLVERKRRGDELACEPRIEAISGFVESELERFSQHKPEKNDNGDYEELNQVFRELVRMV